MGKIGIYGTRGLPCPDNFEDAVVSSGVRFKSAIANFNSSSLAPSGSQ
jgi:hypothetical protein